MSIIGKLFNELKVYLFVWMHAKQIAAGKRLSVRRDFFIKIDKDARLTIGDHCFFNNNCSINVMNRITIGNDCLFGENVKLYDHDHSHRMGHLFRNEAMITKEVIVGNNCWIGSNCVILKGVHIGDNVVVGAGTIVTHDIPDNTVVYQKRENVLKKLP
ncbi:acyltransferase [Levilactobacillus brevis]|uniref:acyltransferase n=1 Tax=Levilactobacillus brevis TaxID=1580 RepID=UPI0025A1CAA7|nr:acyltransferase [Levilactobacillus brevis]MDM7552460.1 acyltransferase [Levilactobacillus brevis]MDM7649207.1 acyltransferase [Levilactobacillus brevis]